MQYREAYIANHDNVARAGSFARGRLCRPYTSLFVREVFHTTSSLKVVYTGFILKRAQGGVWFGRERHKPSARYVEMKEVLNNK